MNLACVKFARSVAAVGTCYETHGCAAPEYFAGKCFRPRRYCASASGAATSVLEVALSLSVGEDRELLANIEALLVTTASLTLYHSVLPVMNSTASPRVTDPIDCA